MPLAVGSPMAMLLSLPLNLTRSSLAMSSRCRLTTMLFLLRDRPAVGSRVTEAQSQARLFTGLNLGFGSSTAIAMSLVSIDRGSSFLGWLVKVLTNRLRLRVLSIALVQVTGGMVMLNVLSSMVRAVSLSLPRYSISGYSYCVWGW